MRKKQWVAVGIFASIIWSCEPVQHPQNAKAGDEICKPECNRVHQCDPHADEAACLDRCRVHLSTRTPYWSDQVIGELANCGNKQACAPNVEAAIDACILDTKTRYPASPAVRSFCEKGVERARTCGDRPLSVDLCTFNTKLYSDAIVDQLTSCLDDPCRHAGGCLKAVIGAETLADIKDRPAGTDKIVPKARTTITLSGKIVVYNDNQTTIAGAKICVAGSAQAPCATSDASGHFSIDLPAAQDLAIVVDAPKPEFAPIVFGLSAREKNASTFVIGVPRVAVLVKRYGDFGATYPSTETGFVRAIATAAKGSAVDISTVVATISPAAAFGPFTSSIMPSDTGSPKPMQSRTSFFAGIVPGTVEIAFGPSSLSCTPAFGAWSTDKPNTVRAPVVAGYETQVYQRCGTE